ncbi:polyprenyl synthetase [Streptomyces sp. H39-S7]|uniref:polyprenyl synthetase n=1 Tax=Streptomyces sp. H39-S7 TaxID=3004357 RepID=UPI0022AECBDD|nr:polyprenyl synthetase [Streptomyces sp. H39-S7]MCZ4125934.1 polyprenyl synthetase [Streptomyces sp. H39-S7]
MTHHDGCGPGLAEDAVALVAGLADLAFSGLSSAVGGVSGLLRRADIAELLADGQEETKARGRLLLDRHAAPAPAHLEILARTVTARLQAEHSGE